MTVGPHTNSYANDRTNLIAVTFDGDKATKRVVFVLIVALFIFTAVPVSMGAIRVSQSFRQPFNLSFVNFAPTPRQSLKGINTSHDTESSSFALLGLSSSNYAAWNLSWDEPIPRHHCQSFGRREYTAKLQNLPFFANRMGACNHTRIVINGIPHDQPSSCESKV